MEEEILVQERKAIEMPVTSLSSEKALSQKDRDYVLEKMVGVINKADSNQYKKAIDNFASTVTQTEFYKLLNSPREEEIYAALTIASWRKDLKRAYIRLQEKKAQKKVQRNLRDRSRDSKGIDDAIESPIEFETKEIQKTSLVTILNKSTSKNYKITDPITETEKYERPEVIALRRAWEFFREKGYCLGHRGYKGIEPGDDTSILKPRGKGFLGIEKLAEYIGELEMIQPGKWCMHMYGRQNCKEIEKVMNDFIRMYGVKCTLILEAEQRQMEQIPFNEFKIFSKWLAEFK